MGGRTRTPASSSYTSISAHHSRSERPRAWAATNAWAVAPPPNSGTDISLAKSTASCVSLTTSLIPCRGPDSSGTEVSEKTRSLSIRKTPLLPLLAPITSRTTSGSRPALIPSTSASIAAMALVAMVRLLMSLIAAPAPDGPTW